jgi:hypothetical protein
MQRDSNMTHKDLAAKQYNNHTEQEFKNLRSQIMRIATGRYKWSYAQLHEIMTEWKYGDSLKALTWGQLQSLKRDLLNVTQYSKAGTFDKQGMKMWHEAKLVWPSGTRQKLTKFWMKHYRKSHWNVLDEYERSGTLAMLRTYKNKTKMQKEKS